MYYDALLLYLLVLLRSRLYQVDKLSRWYIHAAELHGRERHEQMSDGPMGKELRGSPKCLDLRSLEALQDLAVVGGGW